MDKFKYLNDKNFNFFMLFFKNSHLRKCIVNENVNVTLDNMYFVWMGNVGMQLAHLKSVINKEYLHIFQTGDEFGFDQMIID